MKKRLFKQRIFNDSAFGWDGLTTIIFSNILLLSTLGLGFLWLFFKTAKTAIKAQVCVSAAKKPPRKIRAVMVAGLCLDNNQPVSEYRIRLDRVIALDKCHNNSNDGKMQIILLGGFTGGSQLSEAQAGAEYLIARGVAAQRIILEQQSQHTLENMQQAKILLLKHQPDHKHDAETPAEIIAVISSRYHLYRILTLASDLQMQLQPVAAEDKLAYAFLTWLRIFKEAYYLHWYWSGKIWVFITQ